MTSAELIAVAAAEVGYHEKASNSQLDDPVANQGTANYTKYSRDLFAAGYYGGHNKQSYAWCCCFTDWCFLRAANGDKSDAQFISCQSGIYGAACNYSAGYYKKAGRFDSKPSVGAQVYFGSTGFDHTGIVEAVDSAYIYTIEGNANNSVCRKKYARSYSKIRGYGHPLYDDDESCKETEKTDTAQTQREDSTLVTVTAYKLRIGSRGNSVQSLQTLLNLCGGYQLAVDGSFGKATQAAVIDYQGKASLESDGIVGKQTWTALINGVFVTG